MLSPNKDVEITDTSSRNSNGQEDTKENDRNKLNERFLENQDTSDQILSKFESLKLQTTLERPKISQQTAINSLTRQQLFGKNVLQEIKPVDPPQKEVPSVFQKNRDSAKRLQLQPYQSDLNDFQRQLNNLTEESAKSKRPISPKNIAPLQSQSDNAAKTNPEKRFSPKTFQLQQSSSQETEQNSKPPPVSETPSKNQENVVFVTPHVKSFRMPNVKSHGYQKINMLNSATQKLKQSTEKQKDRDKEFRSQKILFATPVATSRPPVASIISNDSICLTLDDTPVKNKGKPLPVSAAPSKSKLSPINERLKPNKKSSDSLFNEFDETGVNEIEDDKNIIVINNVKYSVTDKLGSGGSSSVFLAQNKNTKNECAIKVSFFNFNFKSNFKKILYFFSWWIWTQIQL